MYWNPVKLWGCFLLSTMGHISVCSVKGTETGTNIYVQALMEKYGDGNEMTFEGLEHLMHSLGLAGIIFDHGIDVHKVDGGFKSLHSHHNHSMNTPGGVNADSHKGHSHTISHDDHHHGTHEHNHDTHGHNHGTHGHNHGTHGHKQHDETHDHTHKHAQKHIKCEDKFKNSTHLRPASTPKPKTRGGTRRGYRYKPRTSRRGRTKSEKVTNDTVIQPIHEGSMNHSLANTSRTSTNRFEINNETEFDKIQKDTEVKNSGNGTDGVNEQRNKGQRQTREIDDSLNEDKSIGDDPCFDISQHNDGISETSGNCLSVTSMLKLATGSGVSQTISKTTFLQLCPILIQQMDSDACHTHNELHHNHPHHDHSTIHVEKQFNLGDVPAKVWGYSSLAVVIISLVGLFGVAVIPIMQRVFYQHLLQFLVALAVGALSGDALLHLIPHALAGGHGEESGSHSHGHDEHAHSHDKSAIYKCLCGLMGLYFFYILERCLHILTDFRKKKKKRREINGNVTPLDEEQMAQINIEIPGPSDDSIEGHGHGHSHRLGGSSGSVSAVAWMVILGDGVHNFCDGLAIGAAFVSSITGGFSTTIAVFCHELPHEIGDFAMLLKAGMTAKQAIFYNIVSSILCFVGMLIGVAIGNIAGASLWVFVVVAGMFLYIALVDMLPELTSSLPKNVKDSFIELFLQLLGMLIGAGIMLMIALYEEHLQTILE